MPWALLDLDLAYTQARFTNSDPAGDFIPGAPAFIASAGISLGADTGWFGAVRWRYFGARPLIEDASVMSDPTSIVNARLGYVFESGLKLQVDAFNDRHFHPVEPLAVRFTMAKAF